MSRFVTTAWPALSTGNASGNLFSKAFDATNKDNVGIEIVWSAGVQGSFTLLGSMTGVNFLPVQGAAILAPTGAAGGTYVDLTMISAMALQVQFTATGGSTGTISIWFGGKSL